MLTVPVIMSVWLEYYSWNIPTILVNFSAYPTTIMTTSQIKQCPYCGEEVHADAVKCKHCHEYFDAALRQARSEKPWNPGIAALLSFFFPGAGQIYKGDIVRGLILFFATIVGYFLFVIPGIALHIYAVYTAHSAPALSDRTEPKRKNPSKKT
jgi:hypothetical protein